MCVNINWQQHTMYQTTSCFLTCMAWHIQSEFYIFTWLIAIIFLLYLVQSCPVIVCYVQGLLRWANQWKYLRFDLSWYWCSLVNNTCMHSQTVYSIWHKKPWYYYLATIIKVSKRHSILILTLQLTSTIKNMELLYGLLNDSHHPSPSENLF